jgi:hypothetical protein
MAASAGDTGVPQPANSQYDVATMVEEEVRYDGPPVMPPGHQKAGASRKWPYLLPCLLEQGPQPTRRNEE